MTGSELIAAERQRQIDGEGWTAEHDDEYQRSELLGAASNYLEVGSFQSMTGRTDHDRFYHGLPPDAARWPWYSQHGQGRQPSFWKPSDDPVRNLAKAGALIAAEIDRLQRKAESR